MFLGATMVREDRGGQAGAVGQLRFDPFAMLPFCGYNMADYFGHWLEIGRTTGAKLPKIFTVNWFRKGDDGQVPVARLRREQPRAGLRPRAAATARATAVETPIGLVPTADSLSTRRPRHPGRRRSRSC